MIEAMIQDTDIIMSLYGINGIQTYRRNYVCLIDVGLLPVYESPYTTKTIIHTSNKPGE